jgi:geranylgeranyl pyrophosphate synthase
MNQNIDKSRIDQLDLIIRDRGLKVLQYFSKNAIAGISDNQLKTMLQEVVSYWTDMLRPALISLGCEAVGGNESDAILEAGVMLALADAGISIHDDIIDQSSTKHFRMTILGTHGLNNAVLVGDLLIVKAWATINKLLEKNHNTLTIGSFIKTYENACILMCEAQIIEISCRKNLQTTIDRHLEMLWKGNCGIKTCAELGAILGCGNKEEITSLSNYGKNLALLIGLKDDMRDMFNTEGYLIHRLVNESIPLPLLLAAKSSNDRYSRIEAIITKKTLTTEDETNLINLCFEADAYEFVHDIAIQEVNNAISHLHCLKPTESKLILQLIIESISDEIAQLTR